METASSKMDLSVISENDETGNQRQYVRVGEHGATGHKPPTGYLTTFMHLVKGYAGTGIFAMGQAFKNSGIVVGPVLLTIIAMMNLNCQHMLINAATKLAEEEEEDVKPSFSETVEYTLHASKNNWLKRHSKRLGITTNIFLCITELGFCSVYFVFIAEHLIEITSSHGFLKRNDMGSKHLMLAIILGPMWLSTFLGSLKLLLPLSIIANFLMWGGIVLVFYYTSIGDREDLDKIEFVSSYKTLPSFFGMALFAFEGITLVIPLRNEMGEPEKFIAPLGVLNVGMVFVVTLFIAVGVVSYLKYGQDVESSVFLNLPNDEMLAHVTKAIITAAVLFTFTLHMYVPIEITYPLLHRKYGPFKYELLMLCLYKSTAVLIPFTLANVVPFLGLFISLVGSSTGSMLALIIPPLVDFVANQGKLTTIHIIINSMIIIFGIVGGIIGTAVSIQHIVIQYMN